MNTKGNDTNTIHVFPNGILSFAGKKYRCALGRSGVQQDKVEGDGATPAGCFPIRRIFYRADVLGTLTFLITTQIIEAGDGWCDDPADARYNTYVSNTYSGNECFMRSDHMYDIVAVLGYNDDPPMKGKGSAIFMHMARENYSMTEGCIALSKKDLLEVLSACTEKTVVCVHVQSE